MQRRRSLAEVNVELFARPGPSTSSFSQFWFCCQLSRGRSFSRRRCRPLDSTANRDVSGRLSAQHQVLSAVRLPFPPASPLVGVFQAGYAELNAQFRAAGPGSSNPGETSSRPILKSLTAVDRALLRAAAVEVKCWRNGFRSRRSPAWRRSSGCSAPWGIPDHLPAHRRDRVDESRNSRPGMRTRWWPPRQGCSPPFRR